MTTLIAVYDNNGCVGRCDAKCYDAKEPNCDCICGGMNHGAGKFKAESNTREYAEKMINDWKQAGKVGNFFDVPANQPIQLELF